MTKQILNQEHLEAAQKEMSDKRQEMINELSPESQREHEIVNECVQKLTDNGIIFYLFPFLDSDIGRGMWQFNSLMDVVGFDEAGKIRSEEAIKINYALINQFFWSFSMFHNGDFEKFMKLVSAAVIANSK